jgi:hypothetical protein
VGEPTGHTGEIDTPDAPPDDADAGLEGNLGALTDEDWLAGHRWLVSTGVIPPEEAAYLYDPDRDAADVDLSDLSPDPDPKEPTDG